MNRFFLIARQSAWIGAALALVLLAGCRQREPILPASFLPDAVVHDEPLPGYVELAERYNRNAIRLGQLWSSADVEIRWRDERGRTPRETGDGTLMFVRPDRVALAVEKLGKTYLWAGADHERFWLFDNQERTAYVGHHENVGRPCMDELPLPVHPSAVPYLMGLMPLPTVGEELAVVERLHGYYLVEPPGLRLRLLLDPVTARPVRIDLTDQRGNTAVISQLTDYAPVALSGQPSAVWPFVAGRVDLVVVGQEARMTLRLSRQSDGVGRIADRAFDFEMLTRAYRPRTLIELDADCR